MLAQQEEASQGLLLQQAALALQMQGASTLFAAKQPPDASAQALHAALRQQHYGQTPTSAPHCSVYACQEESSVPPRMSMAGSLKK